MGMAAQHEVVAVAIPPEGPRGPAVGLKPAVYLMSGVALVLFLHYAEEVLVPIVLAILIGYALDPVVTKLCCWRVPRAAAAMLVIVAVLGGSASGIYHFRGHLVTGLESLPDTARKIRSLVENAVDDGPSSNALDKIKEAASEIQKTADAAAGPATPPPGVTRVEVERPRFHLGDYLWTGSVSIAAVASQAGVVIFLVFFLLASGDLYKRKLVRIVGGDFAQKRITVEALHEIDRQIERFLVVHIATSVFVAVATWLGLDLIGVSQPAVWGIAAGVLNFVPYLGAIIAAVVLGAVAFVQIGTLAAAGEAAGIALVVRVFEGGLLSPLLMGKAAGINGAALFISLLFWGWLWGLIGVLVAVPVTMIIKTTCERIDGLQSIGELLNDRPRRARPVFMHLDS
jgi:predicted PurR-regulated permease PerM